MSTMMKILIAYDGSSYADAALHDLSVRGFTTGNRSTDSLGRRCVSPTTECLTGLPRPGASGCPAGMDPRHPRPRRRAHPRAASAYTSPTVFPYLGGACRSVCHSPAWAIIKKAEAWQPDLVVMGSHGRSTLSRFVLGSVSHKVLTEAHCSVRIGRQRPQADTSPLRLLIGVDGSPDAAAAVQAVAARAWPAESAVRLVTAMDPRMYTALAFMSLPGETETATQDADESVWVAKTVDPMAYLLRTRGLTVSSVITAGDPKHVLLDEAEQWQANGLFVGARGLSRVERFLLGSVSAAVAARAHCAVEVVRTAGDIHSDSVSV